MPSTHPKFPKLNKKSGITPPDLLGSVADPDPDPDSPDPHVFGPLDPDPLVRGMDPAPDPSIIKKNLDLYCFVTSF
jgi:hypothetical protein